MDEHKDGIGYGRSRRRSRSRSRRRRRRESQVGKEAGKQLVAQQPQPGVVLGNATETRRQNCWEN